MVSGGTDDGSDAAWRPPPSAPRPVEHLDGYTDLVEVGRGGDSVVYRARQESVNRDVAIKVLSVGHVGDPARARRFAREIEITVQLGRQHPNIVTVLATGTTASGRPAVVMDFFEGGTLHDRLRSHGPLVPEEVGRIGEVLADALSFAHGRGVLHRDVKPQNVLVLPTSWVLADFGIARMTDAEHTSSAETFTYRHAAPQILDGHPPTPADDVWSLGSTLYTLLDGRPPFASDDPDDDSALAYLRRARTEPYRPLEGAGTERLAAIIDRCLAKDVAARWASAAELRDAFHSLRASAWEPDARRPADRPAAPVTAPLAVPAPPASDRVEPAPVAISAVSHVARSADTDPTGTGFPGDTGALDEPRGATVPPATSPEQGTKSRPRRLPLVLGVVALTIGLLIGVVGAVLRDDDPEPVTTGTDTPVESAGPEASEETEQPLEGRPDPELRPVLKRIEYDGVNVTAEWTDPADSEGVFYLVMNAADTSLGRRIAEFPPGETSRTFSVPSPLPLGDACFYLVVRLPTGEYGLSDRSARCYTVTSDDLE